MTFIIARTVGSLGATSIGGNLNIILSPHFDDAVLSLGGLIATSPQLAVVVTVFTGTPSGSVKGRWDKRAGFATATEAMMARELENEAAICDLGVARNRILNLGFIDRQYRTGGAADATLQAAIAKAIRRIVEQCGVSTNLYAPASAWHPDHALVTKAVIELWRSGTLGQVNFRFYQDQPYAYLELRRRTIAPLRFANLTIALRWHGIATQPSWLGFDVTEAARKRHAAGLYKSQFQLTRPLLCKMIDDFSRYQARNAGLSVPNAELVYCLPSQNRRDTSQSSGKISTSTLPSRRSASPFGNIRSAWTPRYNDNGNAI
jgi:LmbE family N-acetylglucosaminyl deacetylase